MNRSRSLSLVIQQHARCIRATIFPGFPTSSSHPFAVWQSVHPHCCWQRSNRRCGGCHAVHMVRFRPSPSSPTILRLPASVANYNQIFVYQQKLVKIRTMSGWVCVVPSERRRRRRRKACESELDEDLCSALVDPQFIFSFRRSDFAKADVLSLGVLYTVLRVSGFK